VTETAQTEKSGTRTQLPAEDFKT